MSVASERKAMRETLMSYSLMSIREVAALMDECDPRTARKRLAESGVPDVWGLYCRVDAAAFVLAEREGLSFAEYFKQHEDDIGDLAGAFYRRRKSRCYVYLMAAEDRVKIGVSKRPEQRARSISHAVGLEVEILTTVECQDRDAALALEAAAHEHFAEHRLLGEWFTASEVLPAWGAFLDARHRRAA